MPIVAQLFFALLLLLPGAVFLFVPERVQRSYAKAAPFEAARRFIEAPSYLFFLRGVGLLFLVAGLSLLYAST